MRFKIGDRVIFTNDSSPSPIGGDSKYTPVIGMHGIIISINNDDYPIGVLFDDVLPLNLGFEIPGAPGKGIYTLVVKECEIEFETEYDTELVSMTDDEFNAAFAGLMGDVYGI